MMENCFLTSQLPSSMDPTIDQCFVYVIKETVVLVSWKLIMNGYL